MKDSQAGSVLALIARIVISGVFLWAGWAKIIDPREFAQAIYGYDMLPGGLIVPVAVFLPWLEIWCVAALWLAPPFRRAGWWMILLMLAVFTAAKTVAVSRGLDISCGCTGSEDPMTWMDVAVNMVWIAVSVLGLLTDRRGVPLLKRLRGV